MQLRRTGLVIGLALGLGWATAAAAGTPVDVHAGLGSTGYTDTDSVTVLTSVASASVEHAPSGFKANGSYLVDVISAASVDIVSTASGRWREVRHAGTLGASYQPRDIGVQASGAVSSEPDYLSYAGGGHLTWAFDGKSHTVVLGYSHAHDTIGRSGTPFDVFSRTLNTETFDAGITLTLNASTVLSLVSNLILERGDQSKPYRYIPLFDPAKVSAIGRGASIEEVNANRLSERPLEHLPESRQRYALTARFGHRTSHGTLRVDERLYADSWQLAASTTEVRYYADVSRHLSLWPRFRFHGQTEAFFWRRAYTGGLAADGSFVMPVYRTGDRELGPLTTIGAGIGGRYTFGPGDPGMFGAVLQVDGMRTAFLDALFVTSRVAGMVTLGLEGDF